MEVNRLVVVVNSVVGCCYIDGESWVAGGGENGVGGGGGRNGVVLAVMVVTMVLVMWLFLLR